LKIKLDENLGPSVARIFQEAGHDVRLAREQGLTGKEDHVVIEVCRVEERCLVTLDLDFGHILNYPPARYAGIAVLRLPEPMSFRGLEEAARTLLEALSKREIYRKLWIVSRGKVREYWTEEGLLDPNDHPEV
jgi:predicted nuclease of predicted toxin-antitoxin system